MPSDRILLFIFPPSSLNHIEKAVYDFRDCDSLRT